MSAFQCGGDNDLTLVRNARGKQTIQLWDDDDVAAADKLYHRLQYEEGTWFLDTRRGVPYRRIVLVKNPNLVAVRAMYLRVFASIPAIKRTESLSLAYDPIARELGVTFSLIGQSGVKITGGRGQPFIVGGVDIYGSQRATGNGAIGV